MDRCWLAALSLQLAARTFVTSYGQVKIAAIVLGPVHCLSALKKLLENPSPGTSNKALVVRLFDWRLEQEVTRVIK